MSNEAATVYRVSPKRGEMFKSLVGTIVHDCFKSYYVLAAVIHALCNAHILRELKMARKREASVCFQKQTKMLFVYNFLQTLQNAEFHD